jgi:hypothetical protein
MWSRMKIEGLQSERGETHMKEQVRENDEQSRSNILSNRTVYPAQVEQDTLEARVLNVARALIQKHYTLKPEELFRAAIVALKDAEKQDIINAIESLFRQKMFFPGKSLIKDDVLANKNRKAVFDAIKREPGINVSQLREMLGICSQLLLLHLQVLEKFGFIRRVSFGRNTAFFDSLFQKEYEKMCYYLHKKNILPVVEAIVKNNATTPNQLAGLTSLPRTTLERKLQWLVEGGIITSTMEKKPLEPIEIVQTVKYFLLRYLRYHNICTMTPAYS